MIPLHAGSSVYVSKNELIKTFDPKPAIYTCKLAMVIFGGNLHKNKPNLNENPLKHLDQKKLKSLIS